MEQRRVFRRLVLPVRADSDLGLHCCNREICGHASFQEDRRFPEIPIDLTGKLPENWRDFNREFVPVYLVSHPTKVELRLD